jgi:hypothetical protein
MANLQILGRWAGRPAAALLVAATFALISYPPAILGLAQGWNLNPFGVVTFLAVFTLLASFGLALAFSPRTLHRDALRRTALALVLAGVLGGVGFVIGDAIGGPNCRSGYIGNPGVPCSLTYPATTAIGLVFVALVLLALPAGGALFYGLLGSGDADPRSANARLAVRTLGALPVTLVAAWFVMDLLFSLESFGARGAFMDPTAENGILWGIVIGILACSWPVALSLAPLSVARLRAPERTGWLQALLAGAAAGLWMLTWWFIVYSGECHDSCGSPAVTSARLMGAIGGPVLAAIGLSPAAFALGRAIMAWRSHRLERSVEAMLAEVRLLYANGRLGRSDFLGIEDACEAVLDPVEGSTRQERRGVVLLCAAGLAALGTAIQALILYGSESVNPGPLAERLPSIRYGLMALVLVPSIILVAIAGANGLVKGRAKTEARLGDLKVWHRSLVDKAGGKRIANRRASRSGAQASRS